MKKIFPYSLTLVLIFCASLSINAQYRGDVSIPMDYQGQIIDTRTASVQSRLTNFFENKVQFSHSYSMSFGAAGGSYQSLNAYTNTMNIAFSDKLQGRVDVSFFHSPFGGNSMYSSNMDDPRVLISNAELNYQINDNASIHLKYQRNPYGNPFGYSPFGYGFQQNRFNNLFY